MSVIVNWIDRLRVIAAVALVVICLIVSPTSPFAGALALIPAIGVVCSKGGEAREVVSSERAATEKPLVEEWTPEVVQPRAELTELPVETIEGIGTVYGERLRKAGVKTVQDLLGSTAEDIAKICDVSEDEAQRWIAMSRFCWLETISEEDAEAIVYAAGIGSLKELAEADPEELLNEILEAVKLGHVQVPKGYEFTLENVKKWIEEAKDLISE